MGSWPAVLVTVSICITSLASLIGWIVYVNLLRDVARCSNGKDRADAMKALAEAAKGYRGAGVTSTVVEHLATALTGRTRNRSE